MHIKKGDIVTVRSGDDKGKTGKVLEAFPSIGKVLVEGINIVKKHERARKEGQKGQTVERPMPIHASTVSKSGEVKKVAKKEVVAKKEPTVKKEPVARKVAAKK